MEQWARRGLGPCRGPLSILLDGRLAVCRQRCVIRVRYVYRARHPVTTCQEGGCPPMPVRGAVLRGPVKVRLINDLALDALTERDLATLYGVAQQSINEFRGRNAHQIATARGAMEDHFSALWIADKVNRLAELEDDVEQINQELAVAPLEFRPRLYLAKARALRNAAEELGQLAPKSVNATISVRYEIVGVDMDALS